MFRTVHVLALIAAAGLAAAPAQAKVSQKADAGFVVREVAEVPVGVFETWAGLTAPAKWWSPQHTWSGKAENLYIDSQATGCFCELMPVAEGAPDGTRRGSAEHMRIVQSSPGKVLRMSGALGPLQSEAVHGVLTITLTATPKGTRVVWEYVVGGYMRYKVDEIAPAVDAVLGEQALRLAKHLGGEAGATAAAQEEAAKPAEDKVQAIEGDAPSAEVPGSSDGAGQAREVATVSEADSTAKEFDALLGASTKPKTAPAAKPATKPKKPAAKKPAAR